MGSGPGGYVAALRLADLGKNVLLVESGSARAAPACSRVHSPKALIHTVEIRRRRGPPEFGLHVRQRADRHGQAARSGPQASCRRA
ncbi:MAG: hypothetical protein IPO18_03570 [bacterium]|nr:hypothetical protein [bacterium]